MTYVTQAERKEIQFGPTPQPVLTEVEAAWLACAVDGEGCIGIWREQNKTRRSGYKYRPVVQVVNTRFEFVAKVRSLIDGYVTVDHNPKEKKPTYKTCYRALVSRRAVPAVLKQILPHLVIKQRQAELVLQYCEAVNSTLVKDGQDHELQEHFYLECKALNKRGA